MGRVRWLTALVLYWAFSMVGVVAAQGAAAPDASAQPSVGVLAVTAADEPVLEHLQNMLGHPARRYSSALAVDRNALLVQARADAQHQLVVVDGERGRVEVIRVADGSVMQRELPSTAERSPYAVAFAATELLRLSLQKEAEAEARSAAQQDLTGTSLGALVSAGVELRGNADLLYVRPALDLGLSLHNRASRLWLIVAARAALFGAESHTRDGERLELTQQDLSLEFGLGLRGRRLGLIALLRGGFSVVGWELVGTPQSADTQLRGWLGAALRGQVKLVPTLGLFVEAGLAVTPLRTRYLGSDGVLLEPGRVDAVVAAGLSWDTSD